MSMDMTNGVAEDYYTLLGVRPDGVAPIVDLVDSDVIATAMYRAEVLLREHPSCATVEVWRDGALLEKIARPES